MEMYELNLEVMSLNPKAELTGIKTDCLVFNKIRKDITLSDEIGGAKKCRVPEINQYTLNPKPVVRTETYDLENENWNHIDEDNTNNVFQDGFLVYGMAGTGKTTKFKQMKSILGSNEHIAICHTHRACKLVNGGTMSGISPVGLSFMSISPEPGRCRY